MSSSSSRASLDADARPGRRRLDRDGNCFNYLGSAGSSELYRGLIPRGYTLYQYIDKNHFGVYKTALNLQIGYVLDTINPA